LSRRSTSHYEKTYCQNDRESRHEWLPEPGLSTPNPNVPGQVDLSQQFVRGNHTPFRLIANVSSNANPGLSDCRSERKRRLFCGNWS
jgi:hypothetical protein